MFVSHSEIEVEEHGADALERAFRERSRLVDGHPGFLGLELLRDIGRKGNYLLVTRWSSRDDFRVSNLARMNSLALVAGPHAVPALLSPAFGTSKKK